MIIDCHTHLGHNEHIKANVNQLLKSMDNAGIDQALVFAGELNDLPTDRLLNELPVMQHRDRFHAVASYDFEWKQKRSLIDKLGGTESHEDYLVRLYQAGAIKAVKFYTGYYHFLPSELSHVLRKLESVRCPVIFHCGDCLNSVKCSKLKYAHPLNIDEVAVDYPNMNFIIAHMGFPWHRDAAEVCYKNSNVYADISGFVYGNFTGEDQHKFGKVLEEFLEIAPSNKLLFGTDWPISNQGSYIDALDWLSHSSTKYSEVFTPQYMTVNTIKAFKL